MKLPFTLIIGISLLSCSKELDRKYEVGISSTKFDLIAEKNDTLRETISVMSSNDSIAYFEGIKLFVNRYSAFAELSKDIPYYNHNTNTKPISFTVFNSNSTNIKDSLSQMAIDKLKHYRIDNDALTAKYSLQEAIDVQKEIDQKNAVLLAADRKSVKEESAAFAKTKAGRIQKLHPDWSKEDCISLSKDQIWVGMTYDMLRYKRGKPNSANPSNYGSGTQWQWCWHDWTPSCFYDNDDDGKIDSYN